MHFFFVNLFICRCVISLINLLFNPCGVISKVDNKLSYESIIFGGRVSITFFRKILRIYGNIRFVKNSIDILNVYSFGTRFFLGKRRFKHKLKYSVNETKNNYVDIEIPELSKVNNKEDIIILCCYIMSILLTLPYDESKNTGDIILNEMKNYMGVKKNIISKLLFGNLQELYIPSGNFVSL